MTTANPPRVSRILIDKIANWLMDQALCDCDLEVIVEGTCERLVAAGVPLFRAHLSFSVLHPLYRALGYTWVRGQGIMMEGYRHIDGEEPDRFTKSPYFHMLTHGLDHLRRRLDGNAAREFPVFGELYEMGVRDYLAFVSAFRVDANQGMMGSWSSDRDEGFTDDDIAALLRIQQRLAVAAKMAVRTGLATSALTTYLGKQAGRKVLDGQVRRGDGETTRAAIVFADMRGSTKLAETVARQDYIDTLNAFFDNAAGPLADNGGEILSFVGDGFLAIFPCGRNRADSIQATQRAVAGARQAVAAMAALNRDRRQAGQPVIGFGLGLHIGNVRFGNVGLADRLTFSAFGAAVNEAARLEDLTKSCRCPIIASKDFVDYAGGEWESLGREPLRGSGRKVEILKPASTDVTAAAKARSPRRGDTRSQAENVVLLRRQAHASS